MYSFYVPNGIEKNFQKKKGNSRKNKNNILFDLPYHKFLVTSMYSFLCPKWDRENKNNIPFFHPKKVEKKKYKVFLFIVTHFCEASVYSSVPWIIGNAG